jgi:uncharacterized repeat protein (TIGR01451 family)
MKKYYLLLVSALICSFFALPAYSQMVGTNVFLKGQFLEVGINNNGSFGACGSAGAIPTGYHPVLGGQLASVYDIGHDGWTTGTPAFLGDYTYAGSPFEGWEIQVGSGRVQAFQNCPGTMTSSVGGLTVTGSNTGYTNTGGSAKGFWAGSALGGQLLINKETKIDSAASNVLVSVTLRNTGSTPVPDVYYFRSCDPDISATSSFSTVNRIVYQSDSNRALVESSILGSPTHSLGLGARDSRARVLIYTSWWLSSSVDLATVWSGTFGPAGSAAQYTQGACLPVSCTPSDIAIGLVFNLGTIAPGDSVTFRYGYIYDGVAGFASTFMPPCTGTPYAGTVAANTPIACPTTTVSLSLTGTTSATGLTYQWESSPDSTTWTAITSATNNTYSFTGLTATQYYRCGVTCTASSSTGYTAGKKISYSAACPCLHSAGTVNPNTSSACPTTSIVLNNAGYTSATGVSLQWQSSPDSATWTDISGATSVPYSFTGLSATTYYRLKATCTATAGIVYSNVRKIVFTSVCACTGTPITATATASTTMCSSCSLTLDITGLAAMSGYTYQWQRSADGIGWTNIAGATALPYVHSPSDAYYYRCNVTCTSAAATTPSSPILVSVPYHIDDDSVKHSPDTSCTGQLFYVRTNGTSPLLSVKTYFGDGTNSSSMMSPVTGVPGRAANVGHSYSLPGTYTVKQVLYHNSVAHDSITFSYTHSSCKILSIRYFIDTNANCVKDHSEQINYQPLPIRVDSNGIPVDTVTGVSGIYYKSYGGVGTIYSFTLLAGPMVVSCPSSATIHDTILAGISTYPAKFVGLYCSSSDFDLAPFVTFIANSNSGRATILPRNLLCTPTSGTTVINYSPKYKYVSTTAVISPSASATSDHSVAWSHSALTCVAPSGLVTSRLRPTTGTLTIGDTVHTNVQISPTSGDANTSNNMIIRVDTVVGPYDPNMIEVLPGGCFDNDTTLQFTVHFENKGTDTAHNVHIMDTISANLDFRTLEVLATSAEMDIYPYEDAGFTIVKFDFPNIKLLDSTWEGLNEGMFVYKIKTKPGLADGSTIASRVGIYFDNNEVVMTNTVVNTKGCPEPVKTISVTGNDVNLFPNPTAGSLTVTSGEKMHHIIITNLLGQTLLQTECDATFKQMDVSDLPAGVYLVKVNNHSVRRFVKQ